MSVSWKSISQVAKIWSNLGRNIKKNEDYLTKMWVARGPIPESRFDLFFCFILTPNGQWHGVSKSIFKSNRRTLAMLLANLFVYTIKSDITFNHQVPINTIVFLWTPFLYFISFYVHLILYFISFYTNSCFYNFLISTDERFSRCHSRSGGSKSWFSRWHYVSSTR